MTIYIEQRVRNVVQITCLNIWNKEWIQLKLLDINLLLQQTRPTMRKTRRMYIEKYGRAGTGCCPHILVKLLGDIMGISENKAVYSVTNAIQLKLNGTKLKGVLADLIKEDKNKKILIKKGEFKDDSDEFKEK